MRGGERGRVGGGALLPRVKLDDNYGLCLTEDTATVADLPETVVPVSTRGKCLYNETKHESFCRIDNDHVQFYKDVKVLHDNARDQCLSFLNEFTYA